MRSRRTIIVFSVVSAAFMLGAFRSSVAGQEAVLTEADYAAAMEEMNYLRGDAEGHIESKYWGDVRNDMVALRSLLEQVQKFWMAREIDSAVDFTEQALAASAALMSASDAEDGERADQAFGDLRSTCQACHEEFRERTEDGGYRIKPGD